MSTLDRTALVEDLVYQLFCGPRDRSAQALRCVDALHIAGDPNAIPFAGQYSGARAIDAFGDRLESSLRSREVKITSLRHTRTTGVCHFELLGRARASGTRFSLECVAWAHFAPDARMRDLTVHYCTHSLRRALLEASEAPVIDYRGRGALEPMDHFGHDLLALVQRGYRDLATGNLPAMTSNVAPDVVWTLKGDRASTPYAGDFHGVAGVTHFLALISLSFAYLEPIALVDIVARGNQVDVFFSEKCMAFSTGKKHEIEGTHSFAFDERGKLTDFKSFNDSDGVRESYLP